MKPNNLAICYLRSSKDRSDVSIDVQRRDLHGLAVSRGLAVVDEFADAVESGKDEDRPAFQRLLQELRRPGREWSTVLLLDTSRLSRRRQISLAFEIDCKKRGVKVVYKSLPEGSDDATDMMLRNIMQGFDEYHSLVSRAKGLAGMAENVRQGWRAGGRAPRGYRLEYHTTGAIRDGAPVMKSKLVIDETTVEAVRAYLTLRARGVPRGTAVRNLNLPWPATSVHSMDWQALTYAGHTVWNVHIDRAQSGGEKRRPRSEWKITRDTHPALIDDESAETILAQMERAQQQKRRLRESNLLLTGLLVTPDDQPWHSDGEGYYRVGKGKRVGARKLEASVLQSVTDELSAEARAQAICDMLNARAAGAEPIDGRRLSGLEKRIATLGAQIAKTVDLAAQIDDPTPILRRVSDLENQRSQLIAELAGLESKRLQQQNDKRADPAEIRTLLRLLASQLQEVAADPEQLPRARITLAEVVERIELDPLSLVYRLHFAVRTGDNMASPRGSELSPLKTTQWVSAPNQLPRRRAA